MGNKGKKLSEKNLQELFLSDNCFRIGQAIK